MKIRTLGLRLAPLALLAAMVAPAFAGTIVLNFAGLNGQDQESPNNYYDGGYGSLGSGPGPNYGITFGSNALVCNGAPGGSCNTAEIPGGTGANALFFLSGSGDIMDKASGFTTGFSFYYTSPFYVGTVNVYSGLDGTGTLLATLTLPETPADGNGSCMGENYCPYEAIGVTFSGTAESVDFAGTANYIAFADITLGSSTAGGGTPEPGTLALFGAGLLALALGVGMRRRHIEPRLG